MILGIVVAPASTTVLLASSVGDIIASQDASWRVGSGQSLATHVTQMLGESVRQPADLTRLILIDQGGSYTSTRTAYAFVQALAFACQLPIVLRLSLPTTPLADEIRLASIQPPVVGPIVPRYDEA